MKQNKSTYIFDNFIEVQGPKKLFETVGLCSAAGFTFCVEPWGSGLTRIYVRKDVAHVLEKIEEDLNK
jgi:hypothetical protein